MLNTIVKILTGGVADNLSKAFADYHNAGTEQKRIEARERIASLQVQQKNRELGGKLTAFVQAAWATPFILYTWKLIVWDKMFGFGATDGLSPQLLEMQFRIITLYFGGAAGIGIVRALRK